MEPVLDVTASGSDDAVNEAAKQAVWDTGTLPINARQP